MAAEVAYGKLKKLAGPIPNATDFKFPYPWDT